MVQDVTLKSKLNEAVKNVQYILSTVHSPSTHNKLITQVYENIFKQYVWLENCKLPRNHCVNKMMQKNE